MLAWQRDTSLVLQITGDLDFGNELERACSKAKVESVLGLSLESKSYSCRRTRAGHDKLFNKLVQIKVLDQCVPLPNPPFSK